MTDRKTTQLPAADLPRVGAGHAGDPPSPLGLAPAPSGREAATPSASLPGQASPAAEGPAGVVSPGTGSRSAQLPVPGSMRICGLDLSLTSTGFARIAGGHAVVARLQPGKRKGHDRLQYLLGEILDRCDDAALVVIEGPSYGSTGGREHERGGLWWMVAHALWLRRVPYCVIPPAVLKKFAAGSGNASKDLVLASVIRRYPAVPVDGNDTADALALAAAGAHWYGCPLAQVPLLQSAALSKAEWPALAGTGGAH